MIPNLLYYYYYYYADRDQNGTLDREEIRAALHALGFVFIEDKQVS